MIPDCFSPASLGSDTALVQKVVQRAASSPCLIMMGFSPGCWGWGSAGTACGGTWTRCSFLNGPWFRFLPACPSVSLCSSGLVQLGLWWADGPCGGPEGSLAGYDSGSTIYHCLCQHLYGCAGELYPTQVRFIMQLSTEWLFCCRWDPIY